MILGGALLLLGGLALYFKILIEHRWPPAGQFVELGGCRIHFLDIDETGKQNPPVIVIIHGSNSNVHDQAMALVPLLKSKARLVLIDRPGHGYSSRISDSFAVPAKQADIVAKLMEHLDIDRAIISGHSLGTAVVAAFGVLYPEKTAGLLFLAPATYPWKGGVEWYYTVGSLPVIGQIFSYTLAPVIGWFRYPDAIIGVFEPNPVPKGYEENSATRLALRGRQLRNNAMDVAHLSENLAQMAPRYGEIKAPTVIVTGDKDDIVSVPLHSGGLARDIEGATLVTVPGVGHKPEYFASIQIVEAVDKLLGHFSDK